MHISFIAAMHNSLVYMTYWGSNGIGSTYSYSHMVSRKMLAFPIHGFIDYNPIDTYMYLW